MTQRVRGIVINVHAFGATVRLESGEVASVPIADVNANRATYTRALESRASLPFDAHESASSGAVSGKRSNTLLLLAKTRIDEPVEPASPPPQLTDEHFEEQIASYLKDTQEWELSDAPPAHERHFLRKKRRQALFKSRHAPDA